MAQDGRVEIGVNLNISDAEKAMADLKKAIKEAESELARNPDSGIAQALEDAKRKAGEAQKAIEAVNKASGARGGYDQNAMRFIEDYASKVEQASQKENEMRAALESAQAEVKALEGRGMWFGDQPYDEAIMKLQRITSDISIYKRELMNPPRPENPFGLDTIAGKLREAEIALRRLEAAGKGLGSAEYDKQAAQVAELREQYRQYQAEVTKTNSQRAAEQQKLEEATARAEAALQRQVAEMQQAMELQEIANSAVVANQHIVDLQAELERLQARLNQLKAAGVGLGTEEFDQTLTRINQIKAEMDEYRRSLQGAGEDTEQMNSGLSRTNGLLDKMSRKIGSMFKRVFVFSVMTMALRSVRTYVTEVIKVNDQASASLARLKAAFLTMAQPIMNVVIPVLVKVVDVLTLVVTKLASLFSLLTGSTLSQSAKSAKELEKEREALKATGDAAEEAENQLAGFDEINKLEDNKSSSAASSSGTDAIAPDFEGMIGMEIDGILELFSGIALLAVGAILLFSGNIPMGLALMAIGAAFIADAAQEKWGEISGKLQGELGTIAAIVGGALLAIGLILLLTGANIPLGIGLIIAGAATLATVAAVNWDTLSKELNDHIGIIAAITSTIALVIGLVLAFSGAQIPLGIGLIIMGVTGLVADAAINWESISTDLQGTIGVIAAVVGVALLVIGAVLLFSGANIPLGLGLIAVGAVSLGATIAANWETVSQALQGPIGVVAGIVSVALLVIGAVLLFSGANIPLGLGLLVAGAAVLGATIAANWETIQTALQGPLGAVAAIVSVAFLAIGAILLFTGASIPIGLGLLVVGAGVLAATISANWNTIQTALQGPIGAVVAAVSVAFLAIGAVLLFTGASIPIGLGLLVAGAIGLGLTIAANWDTIVNALQGPIGVITGIISAAVLVLGVILLFTGAGIPLGLGLIAAGAIGLAISIAPNWNFIKDAIKNAYDSMKQWWDNTASKFFTLDYWAELGGNMLKGLFDGLGDIGEKISGWGKDMISGVKDFFGIHSPSTEFESIGDYMMSGLENGITGDTNSTVNAFKKILDLMTAEAADSTKDITQKFSDFMQYMQGTFLTSWNNVWSNMSTAVQSSVAAAQKSITSLNKSLSSITKDVTVKVKTVTSTVKATAPASVPPNIRISDVPALAKGAVIPPNRRFLAQLGDQRNGNNLEMPEDLVRQIVRSEVTNGVTPFLRQLVDLVKAGHVISVDGIAFGRAAIKGINRVNAASGTQNLII